MAVTVSHYVSESFLHSNKQNRWIARRIEGWRKEQICDKASIVKILITASRWNMHAVQFAVQFFQFFHIFEKFYNRM